MKAENITQLIGNTPTIRINKLFDGSAEVWAKLEKQNPGGSIKDRIALSMIEDAEQKGIIKAGDTIVEPTSGNTGIGLAMVGAAKGYNVVLVMPESLSTERRRLITAYGAKFVLTPKEGGMNASIQKAEEIVRTRNAWMPMQFKNPANPNAHARTTAKELIADFPEGFDALVTGVGTGGHISGTARILKQKFPDLKVYAVEPEGSAVISGEEPGPHGIQGIGAGFIPDNLDLSLVDGQIQVSKEDAYRYMRLAARKEGVFMGISSGASFAAVQQIQNEFSYKRILTFVYDTGERYLSVEGLF
jgi:cysteine synthase A